MAGALIVTAQIVPRDLAWLDELRRLHYPPERNRVPAHLTMFHALPPSAEGEVLSSLRRASAEPAPIASIEGLMDLGTGVAFRVVSIELDRLRRSLAEEFHGLLSAQDCGGWRPHITIQNKVQARQARQLKASLEANFRPRSLGISGMGLHRYLDGSWQRLASFSFRGR